MRTRPRLRCATSSCCASRATVARRREGTENPKLATGEIEIRAASVEVLSSAKTPPFPINEPEDTDETLRLKYRYLDLRREAINHRLVLRSKLLRALPRCTTRHGFVEVETPILIKSTPEGARDFIVPSRLQPGNIYALPQSPQQLKQLLMVAGFDRYYQIAHCMRDEDARADRGPEFTQLDIEMSFVVAGRRDVLRRDDGRRGHSCGGSRPAHPDVALPALLVPRGDRPLRVGQAGRALRDGAARSGRGRARRAASACSTRCSSRAAVWSAWPRRASAGASRSQIDELTELAKRAGAKGLVHMAVGESGTVSSPVLKFLGEDRAEQIVAAVGASPGDLVLIVADADIHAQEALGEPARGPRPAARADQG